MKTIVIVEHDQNVIIPLKSSLEKRKYFVKIAKCTSELMCLMQKQVPDLVLIETNLHGVSGYGACIMVKEEFEGCPVIMMSNKGSCVDVQRAYCAGADDYFIKPLDEGKLCLKIQQLTSCGRKTNDSIKCGAGSHALSQENITS